MKRTCLAILLLVSAFAATPSFTAAQVKLEGPPDPKVVDAKLQAKAVKGSLVDTIHSLLNEHPQAAWVGYAVPTATKPRLICCFDNWNGRNVGWNNGQAGCCTGCKLEGHNNSQTDSTGGTCVQPEPPTHIFVLFRIEGGAVQKMRPYTPDCGLDVGGLDLIWLTGVKPSESVAWLEQQARLGDRRISGNALQAIGLHSDPSALAALERLVASDQPSELRKDAAFWISQTGGHEGFLLLQKLARNDTDTRFREQLMFPLSQIDDKAAVAELIHSAREDASARVRGQAIFWLSQKASKQAAEAITDSMENDPDVQVKKKAVFALSQMPPDEGVPLLIKYA